MGFLLMAISKFVVCVSVKGSSLRMASGQMNSIMVLLITTALNRLHCSALSSGASCRLGRATSVSSEGPTSESRCRCEYLLLTLIFECLSNGTWVGSDAAGSCKELDKVNNFIAWASRTNFALLFDELVKCIQGTFWKNTV